MPPAKLRPPTVRVTRAITVFAEARHAHPIRPALAGYPAMPFGGEMRGSPRPSVSTPQLNLAPEGIDASVPLVRDLLEGLMGLLLHNLEPGVGD